MGFNFTPKVPTMRKIYRYRDLSYAVADDEAVNFTVKFISDGNTGQTVINIPGAADPEIKDQGTVVLGKGKNLRGDITVSFSDIANLAQEEEEICIQYIINDTIIQEHKNFKTEEKKPIVVLNIKFPSL